MSLRYAVLPSEREAFALRRNRGHRGLWLVVGLVAVLLSVPALAQNGAVSGSVLDGRTGQPLRGATISVGDAGVSATTDIAGVFRLRLPVGSYTAEVSADGYAPQEILGIEVTAGGNATVSAVLMPVGGDGSPASTVTEEITVVAAESTAEATLSERRGKVEIAEILGSEEMSRNVGSSAASALKRVTGISLQDEKFVYVRGLGDRYSNTQLDGSRLPSTEFESKVVPLNLFPTGLLEKISVSKSYSADQPGDFAAGVVELQTKNFPPSQKFRIGVQGAYNDVTTGDPFREYGTGLSASGSGGQQLPGGFPDGGVVRLSRFLDVGFPSDELEALGESLIGAWTPTDNDDAPLNAKIYASYGDSSEKFGYLISGIWEDGYETRKEERNYYQVAADGGVQPQNDYDFDYGTDFVRTSLMGNFAYRAGDSAQIRLRPLYTEYSTSEGRFQEGFSQDFNNNLRDYRGRYRDQTVASIQLAGDHLLSSDSASLLEWSLSGSDASTEEDLRETIYEENDPGEYFLSNQGQSGFFYFNDLDDEILDGRGDWSRTFDNGSAFGTFKAGARYWNNERDFRGRRLRYVPRSTEGIDLSLLGEDIYTAENIQFEGFELNEITNATDSYRAEHDVSAAYAQGDWSRNDWRIIAGLRYEDSAQDIITIDRAVLGTGQESLTEIDDDELLPVLGAVYSLNERQDLRFSYSRTLNRPEFREIAPFRFVHIVGGFVTVGNPDLITAKIDSFDVRWEWFPTGGEVIAASVFYKDFTDPIENVVISAVEPTETFQNVKGGENLGFELEVRKGLGGSGVDTDWTGILNFTYLDSEVEIDPATTVLTNPTRPLTGQPDNLANIGIEWAPRDSRHMARALYNFSGEKIFLGGTFGLPDVIEEPRGTLDAIYQYGFQRGLHLKLQLRNLTDEEREWTQGGEIWRRYDEGRGVSVEVGWEL